VVVVLTVVDIVIVVVCSISSSDNGAHTFHSYVSRAVALFFSSFTLHKSRIFTDLKLMLIFYGCHELL